MYLSAKAGNGLLAKAVLGYKVATENLKVYKTLCGE